VGSGIDEWLVMTRDGNESMFYSHDGASSVRNLTDASRATIQSFDYDAYGEPDSSGSTGNAYLFQGRRFDEDAHLYHFRFREYDPQLGRFLNQDPVQFFGGLNLYSFVGNNPVNRSDWLGLQAVPTNFPLGTPQLNLPLGWPQLNLPLNVPNLPEGIGDPNFPLDLRSGHHNEQRPD
jgi:RHS repeat-associated protein